MSMKKQPAGVKRTARVKGEKPPQSYDLHAGEVYLGWSERLPKGMWQAHPASEHTDADIPPFKDHTQLVEFLLSVHKGLENTSEASTSVEDEAVQKGEEELENEQTTDPAPAISDPAIPEPSLPPGPDTHIEVGTVGDFVPADILDELTHAETGDPAAAVVEGEGPRAMLEAEVGPELAELAVQEEITAEFGPQFVPEQLVPSDSNGHATVQGEVVAAAPFRAPPSPEAPEGTSAPEAGPALDPGSVLFRAPVPASSEGDQPERPAPGDVPAAPFSALWQGGAPPDEDMS